MACGYATCVDKGNKCKCFTDTVVCGNCGKIVPRGSNKSEEIQEVATVEADNLVEIQPTAFLTSTEKPGSEIVCRCKESCREWIWSFLGLGSSLPGCCKDFPVTAWDSGEAARTALRDSLLGAPPRDSGGGKTVQYVKRSSKVNLAENVNAPAAAPVNATLEAHTLKQTEEAGEFHQQQGRQGEKYEPTHDKGNKKIDLPSKRIRVKHRKGSNSSFKSTSSKSYKSSKSSAKYTVETPADIEAKLQSKFESFDRHLANSGDSVRSPSASADNLLDAQKKRSRAHKTYEFFNPFHRRIRNAKCPRLEQLKTFYCPQLLCVPFPRPQSKVRVVYIQNDIDKSSISKSAPQANQKDPPVSKERPLQTHCGEQLEKDQQLRNTSIKQQNRVERFQNKCCAQFDKEQSSENKGYKQSDKGQQLSTKDPRRSNKPHKPSESTSMPCTSCFAPPEAVSRFCKCTREVTCGGPKLPCRSQSFHSTLLRSPSPLAVVLPKLSPCCRPCVVSTGRPRCRRFKCPAPTKCVNKRSRSCSRSCPCAGRSPFCSSNPKCKSNGQRSPGPCVPRRCVCDVCPYGTKPLSCLCSPCCTRPCCLPCPRKFTVFPYCQRVDATAKRYLSIPPCKMQSACPCPSGGPCNCPKPKKYPLPCCNFSPSPTCKNACSTPTAMSYIKSKQNDAVCQRLLSKYGFSPPMCSITPASCYGNTSEGICPTSSCTRTYSCSGNGGCKSCHPSGTNQNRISVQEPPLSKAASSNIATPP